MQDNRDWQAYWAGVTWTDVADAERNARMIGANVYTCDDGKTWGLSPKVDVDDGLEVSFTPHPTAFVRQV